MAKTNLLPQKSGKSSQPNLGQTDYSIIVYIYIYIYTYLVWGNWTVNSPPPPPPPQSIKNTHTPVLNNLRDTTILKHKKLNQQPQMFNATYTCKTSTHISTLETYKSWHLAVSCKGVYSFSAKIFFCPINCNRTVHFLFLLNASKSNIQVSDYLFAINHSTFHDSINHNT